MPKDKNSNTPGTKITYRQYGKPNLQKDNRKNLNGVLTMTDENYQKTMNDPEMIFAHVTDDRIMGVNKLKYKGFPFLLVEPNPVTFYFSIAFDTCNQLAETSFRLDTIINSGLSSLDKNRQLSVAYSYLFKVTSISIISSFLALEAFLNQQLPDDGTIEFKNKLWTKEKIQRIVSFEDKADVIIPSLCRKNFKGRYPNKFATILKLRNLRNDLIHLKHNKGQGLTYYDGVYQEILDVDMKSIVNTVKSFINFYYPKLIINYKGRAKRI